MSNILPMTPNPELNPPRDELPASEWASSTLSALGPNTTSVHEPGAPSTTVDQPPASSQGAQSPGVDMPGSFPVPKQAVVEKDAQYVKELAVNSLGIAKQYAQSAAQGAQSVVQTATGKVGEYLPGLRRETEGQQSSMNDTLPSQETSQNHHPSSSGGVGTLPGPPGEVGVAVLPDERTGGKYVDQAIVESPVSNNVARASPIMTTTNNHPLPTAPAHPRSNPLARHTGYIPGTLQDDTSLAKLPEERRLECLPSHDDETRGRLGKSGGVGALPGSASESAVALLPDERTEMAQGNTNILRAQVSLDGASSDASVRRLPGSPNRGASLGQSIPSGLHTTGRDYAFSKDEDKTFGDKKDPSIDTGNQYPEPPPKLATGPLGVGAGSGGLAGAGSPSQVAPPTSPKKSGFMDKVKGEMKILSGKMSHNEGKIEEGRKMMGKN